MLKVLQELDGCNLECDGLSRLISGLLMSADIKHSLHVGRIKDMRNGNSILHFWIVLDNNQTIDFRAKMWLGDRSHIPHGIFFQKDWNEVLYEDEEEISLGHQNVSIAKILAFTSDVDFDSILLKLKMNKNTN
ncbi:hypothetical protein D3C72_1053070 [compost metagenome]